MGNVCPRRPSGKVSDYTDFFGRLKRGELLRARVLFRNTLQHVNVAGFNRYRM